MASIYDSIVEGNRRSFISTNDLSTTGQFCLVKIDGSNAGQIVLASAATDKIIGVCMNAPKAKDIADVYLFNASGTCKAYVGSGGGITAGDALTSDANGQLLTTTTSGNIVIGQALFTANAGDLVEYLPVRYKY